MTLGTRLLDADDAPNAAVVAGIGDRDGVVWAEASGIMPDGRPLAVDTLVYGASLTKQVIGAGLALLVRHGTVDPEDRLGRWLPELPPWADRVRLRHLLHHTSGLPDEGQVNEHLRALGAAARTSDAVLVALRGVSALEHDPGTTERYCNASYVCLGRVIERASDTALAEFVRERLFIPTGMMSSLLWEGPTAIPPGAAPLRPDTAGYWPLTLGDGGMWTTVPDLLRWNAAMLRDDLGVAALIHAPGTLDDGTPLTYGWGVGLRTHAGGAMQVHGGGWWGVHSRLARLPDIGRSVAVVTLDDDDDRLSALTDRLLNLAVGA